MLFRSEDPATPPGVRRSDRGIRGRTAEGFSASSRQDTEGRHQVRTVGVEEELLLVDPESGEPRAMSAAVLARAARDDAEQDVFEQELHEQMLEVATHPQSSMESLH